MNNIKPSKPSFVFGYWRPWNENSNLFDSYLNYNKDTSLAKYSADTIGNYINKASKQQVLAIKNLEANLLGGLNIVNESLTFINRNLDLLYEQHKLSNLLLENISKLLRVPDSEKERQHCIELGIKFFVNAQKDSDLFADALEELLKAEILMKQDYFVLHRIGCIYLYADKFIDPKKSLDYFLRAAKYASIESDNHAVKLVNILTGGLEDNSAKNIEKKIGLLAAASYEKAAFSAYILGDFNGSVNYQLKALKFDDSPRNRFWLAKYQIRNNQASEALVNLNESIDENPELALATLKEVDFLNDTNVLNLLSSKNEKTENDLLDLIVNMNKVDNQEYSENITRLNEALKQPYDIKVKEFLKSSKHFEETDIQKKEVIVKINELILNTKEFIFSTFNENKINVILNDLEKAKNLPLKDMLEVYNKLKLSIANDKIKIGSRSFGGIIFYIDETEKHGLVCTDVDLGRAPWGVTKDFGINSKDMGSGKLNTLAICEMASHEMKKSIFKNSRTEINTAAKVCLNIYHNQYNDWYLPSLNEMRLLYSNLHSRGLGGWNLINVKKGDSYYWTSTEKDALNAWYVCLETGDFENKKLKKNDLLLIRGIRSF